MIILNNGVNSSIRPDFTNTEPAANIGPFPQWADKKKIVSMDPLGHLAPWLFSETIQKENGKLYYQYAGTYNTNFMFS
jgi:hypothetical protein